MLRFIDLTNDYWTDPSEGTPNCAFLSTTSDRFLENLDGEHVFGSKEEIEEHPECKRMQSLIPRTFWG